MEETDGEKLNGKKEPVPNAGVKETQKQKPSASCTEQTRGEWRTRCHVRRERVVAGS